MKLNFIRSVVVKGKPFEGGTVVDLSKVPAGSVNSLIRMGHAEFVEEPEQPAPAVEQPTTKKK